MAVWNLEYLNLSFNWCIAENLSVLLRHRLPSLEALVLRDCSLSNCDMQHLTEAREQGRLPKLESLNVEMNWLVEYAEPLFKNEIWRDVTIEK